MIIWASAHAGQHVVTTLSMLTTLYQYMVFIHKMGQNVKSLLRYFYCFQFLDIFCPIWIIFSQLKPDIFFLLSQFKLKDFNSVRTIDFVDFSLIGIFRNCHLQYFFFIYLCIVYQIIVYFVQFERIEINRNLQGGHLEKLPFATTLFCVSTRHYYYYCNDYDQVDM